jgi:hypothetical protein
MTIAASTDYGLTWNIEGPIILGVDPPAADKETGDSCMTAVRGQDGFDTRIACTTAVSRGMAVTCLRRGRPLSDPALVMATSPGSGTA